MGDPGARVEVLKLARDLAVEPHTLAFLGDRSPAELRDLRAVIAEALHARHRDRVARLAGLSRMLPVPVTAKIAQLALGPMISARVAEVMDVREAAKLAGHLDRPFLAALTAHLDPGRVAAVVPLLEDDLVVDVGRRLLAAGEDVALGRLVAAVDAGTAARVMADATLDDLLRVAVLAEDPARVAAVLARVDDVVATEVVAAAEAAGTDVRAWLLGEGRGAHEAADRVLAGLGLTVG